MLVCTLFGAPETTGTLLVHFRTGGNAIDGEVQNFPGANDGEDVVDVLEDIEENILVGARFLRHVVISLHIITTSPTDAIMDYSVHVQVQIINNRRIAAVHFLVNERISFADVAIKLGDTFVRDIRLDKEKGRDGEEGITYPCCISTAVVLAY